MNEMFIFRRNALLENLCSEWDRKWSACHEDKEKLMRLVLSQQAAPFFADFCFRGKGLTKEYCLKEFGDYMNGRTFEGCDDVDGYTYGMYICDNTEVELKTDVAQFLWCKDVAISLDKTKAATIYVSNHSDVHIYCEEYNNINIKVFDDSKVTIEDCDENTNILVYKYSDKCEVNEGKFCFGEVKQFNKKLRL